MINGKNVYNKPIYYDLKRQEEIRKSATGQGEDQATRCFLDYNYIKNHYKIIAVDFELAKSIRY